MQATIRPQKITFADMRSAGVRGLFPASMRFDLAQVAAGFPKGQGGPPGETMQWLAARANHFQLPCPKTEAVTGNGYIPTRTKDLL
jgi:hypothetical protein